MNRIKAAWQNFKSITAMTFPRASSWFFQLGALTQTDYQRAVGDGLDSNVIVSPLLWIGRTFPEARLAVKRELPDGETEIDRGHEMSNLVRRPNKFYTGDALWMATLLSYLTDGNAYWVKVRGVGNKVAELWYLPHWMVTPKGDEKTFITHYEYKPGSQNIKIMPEDIVHFRYGLDPRNSLSGFGLLRTMLIEVYTDGEAAQLSAALLKNRGVPGLLISPEKDVVMQPGDAEEMKAYVDQNFGGRNRGRAMVIGAATKIQQFGFSPGELDLSALRNVSEERVCAALGLPASVVGFGSGLEQTKVGATMRENIKLAWTGCLLPIQRMLASDLTTQMLGDFDNDPRAEVYFDPRDVEALQADALQTAQAVQVAVSSGVMMRSEGRRRLNLDTGPEDDIFLVPLGSIETPRGQAIMQAPIISPVKSVKAQKRLTTIQARILRARTASAKRHQLAFKNRVSDFLNRFGVAVEHAFTSSAAKDASDDNLRIERMFSSLDEPRFESELRSIFGSEYYAIHKDNVEAITGLGIAVDMPDSVAIEILAEGGKRAELVDLTESSRARAFDVLRQSRDEGLGVEATARRMRDAVPAGPFTDPNYRAELIARTETRYAQTTSSMRAYQSMEGVLGAVMIDARLGNTDAECEAINGTPVTFAEAQQLLDAEHPNGTRDIVPDFVRRDYA